MAVTNLNHLTGHDRFLGGESDVFGEIVEFQGLQFDEASVVVQLPHGQRTFNIESPEAGHAVTQELDGFDEDDQGEPLEDSIFAGLRDALTTVRAEE
jgi:hypothetical protein